jgi:hypothetical protein
VTPTRLLDTRSGLGGPAAPFGATETRTLTVTGGVVPEDASGVVLNTTVTGPSLGGYLTVFPTGVARPGTSNLNFGAGITIPNLVTTGVGSGGTVSIYNDNGTTHVIADVVGYYRAAAGARYAPIAPIRLLDSRSGQGGPASPWGAGETRSFTIAGGFVPVDATAAVVNVTVTEGTAESFLTVFPAGVARPVASNLNFVPGQTIPNLVIVGIGSARQVSIYNNAGSVHVLADVVGYYKPGSLGGRFTPVTPKRLLDTRLTSALGGGEVRPLVVRGGSTTIPTAATAVVTNVTAVGPSTGGYLTVFPAGTTRPLASNLNFGANQTIPNLVIAGVGTTGAGLDKIAIYNDSGPVHVLSDVVGYFT